MRSLRSVEGLELTLGYHNRDFSFLIFGLKTVETLYWSRQGCSKGRNKCSFDCCSCHSK